MLKVVNLKKRYSLDHGNVDALRGISFEVAENEFFTLLGPSGSGKSTAMRCIAGLEHPLSGEIFIDDQWIGGCDDMHLLEAEGKLDKLLCA